ncbi:hypothetical protein BDF19DRAFT_282248 [Syncephalis fuscata]|nr:hypothetical protein BDF19DRAFT_282248 [Syncephalis fuscata]
MACRRRQPRSPKITRANIVERLLHKDLTNYVTILSKVNTPDVPQGSNFHSLTRVCMMRCAQPNRTRIRVTCKVEWQKSTWLKGPIEKGVMEGNQGFYRALFEDVKRYLKSPQPAVNAVGTVGQDLYQRRRRGSRAHGPGDRSRNLAEGDTLLDASKIAAHNTSTSGTTEDTSVFDAFFGWFTPIRILGLFVVALCIAINIWCWYQLTGPSTHLPSGSTYLPPTTQRYTRNQEYEQTSHLGYSNDYIDTEKKPISSQFDETMRTGDAMDRLLAFLSKLRHTHETSPDSQLYLAEMDDLQQRLLMSYNRFRQLDLRVIELTRKIVDTDRELRRLMHAVEAERAVLMDEMDHIVSVYNVPPTPTDQTAASSSQTTSETVFGAEETTTSKADTSVRQEKEAQHR